MRSLHCRGRWLPAWLAALVLFAQLATAAYACPLLPRTGGGSAAMADMPDCAAHSPARDAEHPQLCKAHCEAGLQSVDSQAGAVSIAPPVLMVATPWVRALEAAEAAQLLAAQPGTQPVGPPDGTPPLYLSLLVLRN